MILLPVTADYETPGYILYATGDDPAWIVFTVLWFDVRCGMAKQSPLSGWPVFVADA